MSTRAANAAASTGFKLFFVMAGHSRPKDGVLSHAYVPAISLMNAMRP
jgi:hypothetical protein